MSFWTAGHIADIVGGRWLVPEGAEPMPGDADVSYRRLEIDSREVRPRDGAGGDVFVAITGPRHDGHDYLPAVFKAAVAWALVSDASKARAALTGSGGGDGAAACLLVDGTVEAMTHLATAWREELAHAGPGPRAGDGPDRPRASGCRVISVSGSNGKTTTRHMIHHVLTHGGLTGTQSPKSFNNHIGVPYTLLNAKPEHDFVAVEVGSNHPGEIDALGAIVRPDIAVITSIGEEHLEFFGDINGVAEEEAAILQYVTPHGYAKIPDGACWPNRRKPGLGNVRALRQVARRFKLRIPGTHNIDNARNAAAVAVHFGMSMPAIRRALETCEPIDRRMQVQAFDDVLVLNDSYNANPASMVAAIATAKELAWEAKPSRRCVILLGDMLEMGPRSIAHHRRALRHATCNKNPESNRDLIVTVGPDFARAARSDRVLFPTSPLHQFPAWSDDLPGKIAAMLEPGDVVLIKGSRGMGMWRILPAIEARFGPGPEPDGEAAHRLR